MIYLIGFVVLVVIVFAIIGASDEAKLKSRLAKQSLDEIDAGYQYLGRKGKEISDSIAKEKEKLKVIREVDPGWFGTNQKHRDIEKQQNRISSLEMELDTIRRLRKTYADSYRQKKESPIHNEEFEGSLNKLNVNRSTR